MSELVKTTNEVDPNKVRRLVTKGGVSPLSPEREQAPFLLFLAGDTLQEVALKQQIPRDILEVTAAHYQWEDKRKAFGMTGLNLAQMLQQKIANTLIITAFMQVQKDLAEVAAGTKEAKDCLFIPKSTAALTQLVEFWKIANNIPTDPNKQANTPAVTVQVTTGSAETPTINVSKVDPEEKRKMLQEMASKKRGS